MALKHPIKQRPCQECGNAFQPDRASSRFCSRACCKTFNNRRMIRGAELYDFIMTSRYQRTEHPAAITTIAQIARDFRDEDKRDRNGRFSWSDIGRSDR